MKYISEHDVADSIGIKLFPSFHGKAIPSEKYKFTIDVNLHNRKHVARWAAWEYGIRSANYLLKNNCQFGYFSSRKAAARIARRIIEASMWQAGRLGKPMTDTFIEVAVSPDRAKSVKLGPTPADIGLAAAAIHGC